MKKIFLILIAFLGIFWINKVVGQNVAYNNHRHKYPKRTVVVKYRPIVVPVWQNQYYYSNNNNFPWALSQPLIVDNFYHRQWRDPWRYSNQRRFLTDWELYLYRKFY